VGTVRAFIVDPASRLEALVAGLRALSVEVTRSAAPDAAPPEADVLFVDGDDTIRAAAHAVGGALGALVVEITDDLDTGAEEAAFARGTDDVLVLGREHRLPAIVRRAARNRGGAAFARAEALLARVSDLVLQVDAENVVRSMNRESALASGARLGADVVALFPDPYHAIVRQRLGDARATGEPTSFDVRIVGRTFHVGVVPLDRGAVALLARDETEVSDVLDRLGHSEARAGAILAAMPDLVFRMTADATFVDVHAPENTQLLVPAEQIPGRKVGALLPPDVAAIVEPAVARAVRDHATQVATYELDIRGTRLSYEARIVPIGRDQVLAVVRNMTEYNERRERLALADRLASLGTMAAGVAHEINGPLTFVMLGLEWLERHIDAGRLEGDRPREAETSPADGTAEDGSVRERLRAIADGVSRIQRIVRDLKGFTRKDDLDGTADVASALDGALRLAAAEIRQRGKVERTYAPVPPVRGSVVRLGQVFSNLIVNAAHALPEEPTAERTIHVRTALAADGRVAIEIADSGRGIAPHHVPHLFEPFFTTKPVGQGTGLGLWICHEIVKELGGELVVESELGKGSTFRVLLPCAEARAAAKAPPTHAPPPPRARILVIDDEPNLARTLAILLNDHTVEVAIGGAAGLTRLERDTELDLVLCDLMMPEITGMDVYAEVCARWPALAPRFVFMTGGAFTPRARAFLATCERPHLEKPFRAESVRELLRAEALRYAEERARKP